MAVQIDKMDNFFIYLGFYELIIFDKSLLMKDLFWWITVSIMLIRLKHHNRMRLVNEIWWADKLLIFGLEESLLFANYNIQ